MKWNIYVKNNCSGHVPPQEPFWGDLFYLSFPTFDKLTCLLFVFIQFSNHQQNKQKRRRRGLGPLRNAPGGPGDLPCQV